MSLVEILIFFFVIWWPIFFILLPVGFEPITKYDEETRYIKSAPNKPNILKKFFLATAFSFCLTTIVWILDYIKLFSLKEVLL